MIASLLAAPTPTASVLVLVLILISPTINPPGSGISLHRFMFVL
jgi:hypothetical protein